MLSRSRLVRTFVGKIAAGADDPRVVRHAALLWMAAMRSVMCAQDAAARLLDRALRCANPKANTSAEPWLLMTMPRSPSSVAPL